MRNYSKDSASRSKHSGGFGGRKSFGDRKFGGRGVFSRGDRGGRQMYSAICSNCGKDCQVPFNPSGDKPVYCSDCFEKMGNRSEKRPFVRHDDNDRSSSEDKYKFHLESIGNKLDKIIDLLQTKDTESSVPADVKVETPVKKIEVKPGKSKKSSLKKPKKESK